MSKQNLKIRNVLTPSDIFAVLIIAAGLAVAVFFEETAIRMIGVSISILGAVALFMLISQRMSEVVDTRFSKSNMPAPDFKVTTTQDSSAKRQTVEDFERSFGSEDDFPVTKPPIIKKDIENTSKGIINNADTTSSNDVYNDGFSGMRIVGKIKSDYKDQKTEAQPKTFKYEKSSVKPQETNNNPIHKNIGPNHEEYPNTPENLEKNIISEIAAEPANYESVINYPVELKDVINMDVELNPEISQPLQNEFAVQEETEPENRFKGKAVNLPVNVFMETEQLLGDEPRKEFEYFMTRVLMLIRTSTDTRTALFMLYDESAKELILESYVTSVPQKLKSKLKLKLANDIISQIISNAKPQILSEINPAAELDLLPYYKENAEIGSFIGVPVFWEDGIVGVLTADSESKDAFDASTVAFLGHFTKLVGALVRSYTHKRELMLASIALESVNTFYTIAANSRTGNENISDSIADSFKKIFPNASVGICGFDGYSDTWKVKTYKGKGKDISGMEIDIEKSLIGQSIYECRIINANSGDSSQRVYKDENILNGHFIAIPIKSSTQIYGAVYLETETNEPFSEFDVSIIDMICSHAGNNIEKLFLLQSLHESALIDSFTGLMNPVAFYKRINEELIRAKDYKSEMTLCFFRFDKYASFDPVNYPSRFQYTTSLILERIKMHLKIYDIIGSIDENTYGILFPGKDSTKTRITAERIRSDVANTIIEHGGGRYSVTISMGLISPSNNFDINDVINDTFISLERAVVSGNQVQVLY